MRPSTTGTFTTADKSSFRGESGALQFRADRQRIETARQPLGGGAE